MATIRIVLCTDAFKTIFMSSQLKHILNNFLYYETELMSTDIGSYKLTFKSVI